MHEKETILKSFKVDGRSVLPGESEDSSIYSLALTDSITGCKVMYTTLRTSNYEPEGRAYYAIFLACALD